MGDLNHQPKKMAPRQPSWKSFCWADCLLCVVSGWLSGQQFYESLVDPFFGISYLQYIYNVKICKIHYKIDANESWNIMNHFCSHSHRTPQGAPWHLPVSRAWPIPRSPFSTNPDSHSHTNQGFGSWYLPLWKFRQEKCSSCANLTGSTWHT